VRPLILLLLYSSLLTYTQSGTVALQRVITQMKGLRSNNSGELKYNPDASRVAGLNTYCNYLVGKATIEKLPTVEQILNKNDRR
jgi:hypothetical protein